jgi:hypothetical protein
MADLCSERNIEFVLGHALYMKAIHRGKTKNDKIDSFKIDSLLTRLRQIRLRRGPFKPELTREMTIIT